MRTRPISPARLTVVSFGRAAARPVRPRSDPPTGAASVAYGAVSSGRLGRRFRRDAPRDAEPSSTAADATAAGERRRRTATTPPIARTTTPAPATPPTSARVRPVSPTDAISADRARRPRSWPSTSPDANAAVAAARAMPGSSPHSPSAAIESRSAATSAARRRELVDRGELLVGDRLGRLEIVGGTLVRRLAATAGGVSPSASRPASICLADVEDRRRLAGSRSRRRRNSSGPSGRGRRAAAASRRPRRAAPRIASRASARASRSRTWSASTTQRRNSASAVVEPPRSSSRSRNRRQSVAAATVSASAAPT